MNIKPFTTVWFTLDAYSFSVISSRLGLVSKSSYEGQAPTHRNCMAVRCNLLRSNNGSVDSSSMRKFSRNVSLWRLRTSATHAADACDDTSNASESFRLLAVSLRTISNPTTSKGRSYTPTVTAVPASQRQPNGFKSDELRTNHHSKTAVHAARDYAKPNVTALWSFALPRIGQGA